MPNTLTRLPTYATDLLEELDATFPHRCIGETERPESAQRYAGKRELIDFLLQLKARADQNILKR